MKRFAKDIHNTTDYYLIRCLQINRDEESLHELNRRYEKFCFKQMHKYKNYLEENGIKKEELFSYRLFLIYDAAKTFKKSKNIKYITWLGSKIRFFCLNSVNEKTRNKLTLEFKENINDLDLFCLSRNPDNSDPRLLNEERVFSILKKSSDSRISTVFKLRYFEKENKNLAWRNLGEKMNLSSQTVINLHKKGMKLIQRKIKTANNA